MNRDRLLEIISFGRYKAPLPENAFHREHALTVEDGRGADPQGRSLAVRRAEQQARAIRAARFGKDNGSVLD